MIRKKLILPGAVALALVAIVSMTLATTDSGSTITLAEIQQTGYPWPADVASDADHEELTNYAWRMFIAASNLAGSTRGEASAGASFATTGSDKILTGPLVWETFYHRSEAFPAVPTGMTRADIFPSQSTSVKPSYYFQTAGLNPVADGEWNNLDEDNQIGQNALVFPIGGGHHSTPSKDSEVLFQAKVNYNELQYVQPLTSHDKKGTGFELPEDSIELKSAWRLSSDLADTSRYHNAMANYYVEGTTSGSIEVTSAQFSLIALHIIIKTANHPTFIFSTFEQIDSITAADGTPTGLYYLPTYDTIQYQDSSGSAYPATSPTEPNTTQTNQQATYSGAYTTINPSTHASDIDVTTTLPSGTTTPPAGQFPTSGVPAVVGVIQPQTITAQAVVTNQHVWGLIQEAAPDSVWQYYALKGVQSLETNAPLNSMGVREGDSTSPDYYLANIVVESSQPGVQLFQGVNPGPTPVSYQVGGKTYTYNQLEPKRTQANVDADGTLVNIGGCKGCHGVAQTKKNADFSFLVATGIPGGFAPDTVDETETESLEQMRFSAAASPRTLRDD